MSRPSSPFEPPEGSQSLLEKYEVIDWLGEGGMGVVFLVRHRLLGERRVIKMIHPERAEDPEFRERFLQEARTAIRYRHPNIAQVYDFSAETGSAYLVMEYIDGVTLQDLLRAHGPIEAEFSVAIGVQVLEALGFLHRKNVIHRDVSTDNIMLCSGDDGQPLVKLIDLGLVKWMESDVALTAAQVFLGKIRYAPPEQFSLGTSELDPRGDLYSLGIVLYELLTGCYPITGNDASSIIAGHLFHPPRSFEETDPDRRVPQALREVVFHALDKDRTHRPLDARAFQNELRASVPSWREHLLQGGRLERVIKRVRAATAGRPDGEAAGGKKSPEEQAPAIPRDLGATANISGGTWLGKTSTSPVPPLAVSAEEPVGATSESEDGENRGPYLDIELNERRHEELIAISAPTLQAPALSTSGMGRRWPMLGVAVVGVASFVVLGLLAFRTPRRPELPSGTKASEGEALTRPAEAGEETQASFPSAKEQAQPGDRALAGDGSRTLPTTFELSDSVASTPARRVSGRRPWYPEAARAKQAFGLVRLELEVLPSGKVGRVQAIGNPDPDLLVAARDAVAGWKFEPATRGGRAVASSYLVDLDFELPGNDTQAHAFEGLTPPVRLLAVEPEYPDVAREQGVEGELAAVLTIDSQGHVAAVRISKSLSPELDRAAEEALLQWRFAPARLGERAVESTYAVTIRFDLGG